MEHLITGKTGEDLACAYIKNKGFKIVERNYRKKWGELDIVSIAPDKTLVFFEVKTLRESGNFSPEENLSFAKLKKLQRTCFLYANAHHNIINDDRGWRIDLLAINLNSDSEEQTDSLTEFHKSCDIRHYENI